MIVKSGYSKVARDCSLLYRHIALIIIKQLLWCPLLDEDLFHVFPRVSILCSNTLVISQARVNFIYLFCCLSSRFSFLFLYLPFCREFGPLIISLSRNIRCPFPFTSFYYFYNTEVLFAILCDRFKFCLLFESSNTLLIILF